MDGFANIAKDQPLVASDGVFVNRASLSYGGKIPGISHTVPTHTPLSSIVHRSTDDTDDLSLMLLSLKGR